MVDATLAELIGGEMLFPGRSDGCEARIAHLTALFNDAVAAMRRGDFAEADACLKGLRLVFDVVMGVHAKQGQADRKEG